MIKGIFNCLVFLVTRSAGSVHIYTGRIFKKTIIAKRLAIMVSFINFGMIITNKHQND